MRALEMGNTLDGFGFGKFVRLNLTGEIVEVVSVDSAEIVINFKGNILTMEHYEVSRISPEEAAGQMKIGDCRL